MYYDHERRERKPEGPLNAAWPEMSTSGKDHDRVKQYLLDRQLDPQIAEYNGWYPSRNAKDTYLRVVIPALSPVPGHVYWQARDVTGRAHIRYQSPKGPRADALVSVLKQGRLANKVVVVEGPMDALAAAGAGYDAIACMGITPPASTVEQIKLIIGDRTTLVVFDSEPEAERQAIFMTAQLASSGIRARLASIPGKNDLAKCSVLERSIFLKESFVRFA